MKACHGDIIFTTDLKTLKSIPDGYIVINEDGTVQDVYERLPERYRDIPVMDFSGRMIIPGFVDMHLHASQIPTRGVGYDGTGEQWFTGYAYPVEKKYADPAYADEINRDLVYQLWENGIMRSVIMSTVDMNATKNLMTCFMESGLSAFIGKMNSDYGAFGAAHENTQASMRETLQLIEWAQGKSELVRYCISPEFVPACTAELMEYLGQCAKRYNLPVQSHMGEGTFDLEMVRERFPQEELYANVLHKYGLFGQTPSVMAHCMYTTDYEMELMSKNKVYVAHCPHAGIHIPSGRFFQMRRFLEAGVPVGIGSDIGGGHTLSMMQNMVAAIQTSKLLAEPPLTSVEAFYLATKGGGGFFGKVGSFEAGYEFDALVIDDRVMNRHMTYSAAERLQRFIYCADVRNISNRFCKGKEIRL